MKIEIPKGTGLVYIEKQNTFYAVYFVNNKQVRKSLGTDDLITARRERDIFFKHLKKEGATLRGGSTLTEKIKLKPGIYIYERKPFVVKVRGVYVGDAATRDEAERMLEQYALTK